MILLIYLIVLATCFKVRFSHKLSHKRNVAADIGEGGGIDHGTLIYEGVMSERGGRLF